MKTGSYSTTNGMPGRICISLGCPQYLKGKIPEFKPLAPAGWFMRKPRDEYLHHFNIQLSKIDPNAVWKELHRLAGDSEPIILCYEKPPFTETNWCHRRIVAKWFETRLGVVVPEVEKVWSGPKESNPPATRDLFD